MADKKRSIFVLLLLVITLAACGAAGYFWYSSQSDTASVRQAPPPLPPVFFPLEPMTASLIVKQDGYDVNRVLYVGVTLRLPSDKEKTVLTEYLPEVRSRLLLLLSHQDVNVLATEEGKNQLKDKIIAVLRPSYAPDHSEIMINDVLFSNFILR